METRKHWVPFRWFLMINLICFSLPVLPLLLSLFLEFGWNIRTEFPTWDIGRSLFFVPIVSIPLSLAIALYKARNPQKRDAKRVSPGTASTLSVGFGTFFLSVLMLYGLISVYVLLVMMLASDSSLVGVVYFFSMPAVLAVSVVAACIRMRKARAVLIFLALTVLPLTLYQWRNSIRQAEYLSAAVEMQRSGPTEADWRDFFDRYEDSTLVTGGSHNQLALVLWIDSVPQDILLKYADHPESTIRWSVARNSNLPERYMYEYLEGDRHLRRHLAANTALPRDIVDELQNDEDEMVRDAMSETLTGRDRPAKRR